MRKGSAGAREQRALGDMGQSIMRAGRNPAESPCGLTLSRSGGFGQDLALRPAPVISECVQNRLAARSPVRTFMNKEAARILLLAPPSFANCECVDGESVLENLAEC